MPSDGNQNANESHGNNGSMQSSDDNQRKLIAMNPYIEKPLEKDRSCYSVLDNYTKFVMAC